MFSVSNKSSRTLSNCSLPSRQHILSDEILLKLLSLFSDNRLPKGIACLAIVIKARETLSNFSSPSHQHILSDKILLKSLSLFSDRWSPKFIACLAIGCRKIASEDWAIRHSQNQKRLFSEFWLPNYHCLFSNKRAQNCRIYLAIISSRSPVIISDIKTPNC